MYAVRDVQLSDKEKFRLGEIAYNAYCASVGWKSAVTNSPLPEFVDTSSKIQQGWIEAALMVKNAVLRNTEGRAKE